MPFSGNTYNNVSGAVTAASGQIVQSAVWNNIHSDQATALTQLMGQLTTGISIRNLAFGNGSFEVWQRGAGGAASISVNASTTQYTPDRWYIATGANQASTVAAAAGLTNNSGFSCVVQRNSGQTGTTQMFFGYPFSASIYNAATSDSEITQALGNIVTLSGVVKAGANWSPASGTLVISVYAGTGAAVKYSGGTYAGASTVIQISLNLTAGGAAVAFSATSSAVVPTNTQQMEITFQWTPVGTAGANDSFTVDDIQLESNLSPTAWTPTAYDRVPFNISINNCMRYYQKTFNYGTAPVAGAGLTGALEAVAVATQRLAAMWVFPVPFQGSSSPFIQTYIPLTGSSANWYDGTASVSVAAIADGNSNHKMCFIYSTVSGATTNDLCYIHATADKGI